MRIVARTAATVFALSATATVASAQGTLAWDKTFPRSTRVDHQKVSFYNRLGITLVADLYVPKTWIAPADTRQSSSVTRTVA
jgi:hypothetical protein